MWNGHSPVPQNASSPIPWSELAPLRNLPVAPRSSPLEAPAFVVGFGFGAVALVSAIAFEGASAYFVVNSP